MKVAVVGTGYVGLVTGTCFSELGNHVTCVDIDKAKVAMMQSGKVPIYEPDLENLFKRNIKENRLFFTTDLAEGIKDAEVIFLALPTPPSEDGSADLSYILNVSDQLGPLLSSYAVVIDKSTVPVGTAEKVRVAIAKNAKVDFDVVSNPEFLREGLAVSDFMNPDRVVIGTQSEKAQSVMKELYDPYIRKGNEVIFMDEKSAELTKYAANSFLATKISFMNEIANLAEIVGADVDAIRRGIGTDERIGKRFLFPGIGYGGSCFPKDVQALAKTANDNNYDFAILESVMSVNDKQKHVLVNKIEKYYEGELKDKTFALWGLAFKPDTDDIREAPALTIIEELQKQGAKVVAYDPAATENVKKHFSGASKMQFVDDAYSALERADALIIATEWSEFRTPEFDKIKQLLKAPVIFDGRNLYDIKAIEETGFHYESIGRRVVNV